jgi:hypothetical protein
METVTLYSATEFRKLLNFENSYEWLDLGGESLVLVETDGILPVEIAEAKATVEAFIAGDSTYLHPWDLAASGLYGLPERFVIKL